MCGGTCGELGANLGERGLSPRVRGNPLIVGVGLDIPRSIPACAGEPPAPAPLQSRLPVYPRVCGGTAVRRRHRHLVVGLSPRVRGNRAGSGCGGCRKGSIPACAGEPARLLLIGGIFGVYPRVCGGTPFHYGQA